MISAILLAACIQPALAQTGTFIDRSNPSDLRVVSFNVNWDSIFPDVDATQAAKFERLVNALDPDILNIQEINRSAGAVANLMDSIAPLPGGGSWNAHKGRDSVIVSKFPLSMTATATVPPAQYDLAMALVDLPNDRFAVDFYIMNDHFKCCGGSTNDSKRQKQADALVNWMRDARTPGGSINLPNGTAMAVVGDLNMVGSLQPLNTLITGNIMDNGTYGPDSPPDWDGTDSTDAHPLHNAAGPDDYTWRDDGSPYPPGRLDYIIYTDSAIAESYKFVLNTVTMSSGDLAAAGLQRYDVCMDNSGVYYDHLPVVVDYSSDAAADCNGNGVPDDQDIAGGTSQDCNGNGIPDECETDTDGDNVIDACDNCPNDPNKVDPGLCGCGTPDDDTDGDQTPDCNDGCPNDPNKVDPGLCGCGTPDDDTDGDQTPDCNDGCPNDPNKTDPGVCGCGTPDTDSDGDGVPDCIDICPGGDDNVDTDADGVPDFCDPCPFDNPDDSDGDGVCDSNDICPGFDDNLDTDGDNTPDCIDGCPNDPDKTDPGLCGCGTPDTDTDGDQTPDCNDACPSEPALIAPEGPQELDCIDGIDNDCDGLTDAADTDCVPPACACGDLDNSGGTVDLNDFSVLATCFGYSSPTGSCSSEQFECSDLDGDGVITLNDFGTFAILFGSSTTAHPPNCLP
jgi:endonuclease/exonuclease/phosphatase family metal-dependent hydrolase